jgi:hypothetical protein
MLIAAPGRSAELPALVRGQPGCGARNRDSALLGAARSALRSRVRRFESCWGH